MFQTHGFVLPDINDIHLECVQFYLDLDLDELTAHFGDKLKPYDTGLLHMDTSWSMLIPMRW